MKIFQCQNCAHPLFYENTYCESCRYSLGYLSKEYNLIALVPDGNSWTAFLDSSKYYNYCLNFQHGVCNWLVPIGSYSALCEACELNQTIPNLGNHKQLAAWQRLEFAKHRLIYSLQRFDLKITSKMEAPDTGLAFDFLSDDHPDYAIRTGHFKGLITINLAEADSVHREYIRTQMSEPYRTLIGHFRHEVGHYYWDQLVLPFSNTLLAFRTHFGDERVDYSLSLENHYNHGAPPHWQANFVSPYAASHPWEDWAESWAHYLHLVDTLESAYAFGLSLSPNLQRASSICMQANFDPYIQPDFEAILAACIPLTFAVNSINRSMGQPDLYPFVISPVVARKLRFIHQLLYQGTYL